MKIAEQLDRSESTSKSFKGITFARRIGNNVEIITIPNSPFQTFKYFHNPSKMTESERIKRYDAEQKKKIVFDKLLSAKQGNNL